MKTNIIVEFDGNQVEHKNIEKRAKDLWKSEGNLAKDLKTMDLYVKPEDNAVYCVFNGEEDEGIPLFEA